MSGSIFSIKLDEYDPESSPGPSNPSSSSLAQARKSDRACDFCRRRKTRCDGAPSPNSKCTNCRRNQVSCTYLEASRPRGPPKAYVTALEDRVERFERLLKRLRPEADFSDVLGPTVVRGSWRNDQPTSISISKSVDASSSTRRSPPSQQKLFMPASSALLRPRSPPREPDNSSDESGEISSDEDVPEVPVKRLTVRLGSHPPVSPSDDSRSQDDEEGSFRFHGKSSLFPLIQATRYMKRTTAGIDGFEDFGAEKADLTRANLCRLGIADFPDTRRGIYWNLTPWEEEWGRRYPFTPGSSSLPSGLIHSFPPTDLVLSLLSLYFEQVNALFPLMHAPTFYGQLRDELHLHDADFAGVVWCMMAIGSRWSQDRRVLWDGWGSDVGGDSGDKRIKREENEEWASAGWRFFLRSLDGPSFSVTSLDPPTLFDLQFCSLGATFLRGTSIHAAAWVIIGTGLRKAIDVGAHRKKVYTAKPTIESELWKRAFWMLVLFDRIGSVSLGRPCCVREEDFDLNLPLEVDDEFWAPAEPGLPAFKQPQDKPSTVAGFVSMLKLTHIMAYALRTIYCIDKSKVLLGFVSDDWQEQIVSQLNAALDEWVESIPKHLQWSSNINNEWAIQSSTIYTTYYLTLIMIYRPFSSFAEYVPHPDAPATTSKAFPFPADSICTNAAHSAIRILDVQLHNEVLHIPNVVSVAQICAAVQLMNLHTLLKLNKQHAVNSVVEDIGTCIRGLEMVQSRWIMARKFLHQICEGLPDSFKNAASTEMGKNEIIKMPDSRQVNDDTSTAAYVRGGSYPMQHHPGHQEFLSVDMHPQPEISALGPPKETDWRWFDDNPPFTQHMPSHQPEIDPRSQRYHVPIPLHHMENQSSGILQRSISVPLQPAPVAQHRNAWSGSNLVGTEYDSMRQSLPGMHTSTVSTNSPFLNDQPISLIGRSARASMSGHFLSVNSPQSAARDEILVSTTPDLTVRPHRPSESPQRLSRESRYPSATNYPQR